MKTMLLIAILTGFVVTGGYAQSIDCQQTHVAGTCPGDNLRTIFFLAPAGDQTGCSVYTKGSTVITACPGTPDFSGNVGYNIDGTYKGNYPLACTSRQLLDGTVVVNCRPKCVLMDDPLTGRRWYDCPGN